MNDNDRNSNNALDAILQQWADETTSAKQTADLQCRIVDALSKSPQNYRTSSSDVLAAQRLATTSRTTLIASSRTRVAVGSAVTALLLCVFLLPNLQQARTIAAPNDKVPAYAWFKAEQILAKSLLVNEIDSLFDHRLTWLAEFPQGIDFGLAEVSDAENTNQHVAVRVVVERKQPGQAVWQPAWTLDIVSRGEEVVKVAPRQANGNALRLWAYRLPDGAIAVECEIFLVGKNEFHTRVSSMHCDHSPQEIAISKSGEAEYRVFQSVAVLNEKVI